MKSRFDSIIIELTNYCNFKCPFCPSEQLSREKGFMGLDIMDKILSEISDKKLAENVQFGLMGEPFLHKRLFDMIALCHKYNIKVRVFTNGSLLSDETIEKVLKSGIHELYISYRAGEETGFSANSNYQFKSYNDQIKKLIVGAIKANTIGKIFIKVFKSNVYSGMLNTKNINKRLKTDRVNDFVAGLFDLSPDKLLFGKNAITVNQDVNVISNIYVRFEVISKWHATELSRDKKFKKGIIGACDGLSGHFGILWNGDVTTCCKDYNGNNILGNVNEHSLTDILKNDKARRISKALKYCYLPTEYCRICRGGESYTASALHQAGSIIAYKIPFVKKTILGFKTN